jgi:hypothetical protein
MRRNLRHDAPRLSMQMHEACLSVAMPPLPAVAHLGFLMKIASLFSFVLLSAATLPAEAYDLPEHTVLAFNLSSCPKGWVQYAPAAGAFVVGVGDSFQLGGVVSVPRMSQ